MTKVDIKQPVVSKKLAEDFECIANEKGRAATHNINNYLLLVRIPPLR